MEITNYPKPKLPHKITLPPDKSILHRNLIISAICEGKTVITGYNECDDINATISCLKQLGTNISIKDNLITVIGKGLSGFIKPNNPLNSYQSATTMRLLTGLLTGQIFATTLIGTGNLNHRPMNRIVKPLKSMNADITAYKENYPPITINPSSLKAIDYKLPINSAQVKSSILLAGIQADGTTSIIEKVKTRNHTELLLKYAGAKINIKENVISISKSDALSLKSLFTPGDFSSAMFFIVAAILSKENPIVIENVSLNETRTKALSVLKRMGASIEEKLIGSMPEPFGTIIAHPSKLTATTVSEDEVAQMIDEIPILSIAAAFTDGTTIFQGIDELRHKESDRVSTITTELTKIGIDIKTDQNDLIVKPASKHLTAVLDSHSDHRIAMSLYIAGLFWKEKITISNVECVNKSFKDFFKYFGE